MTKYKLIELYPHSLPLGSISELDYSAYPKNWEPFVEEEILSTTEDGVEIFKDNHPELYWVKNNFLMGSDSENSLHNPDTINYKYFTKKENAEEFIKMNKPEYSRQQIIYFLESIGAKKSNIVINYTIVENEKI